MKIAIVGFSGSGKSTLAREIAEKHNIPVLHMDSVNFLPNWVERSTEEKREIVGKFMDSHNAWVIEGNYSNIHYERRLEEADLIIFLLFNRFASLYRVTKRYFTYRGKSRPDMTSGCDEKLDMEFIRWVLHDGRSHDKKQAYRNSARKYSGKVKIVKNQKQLNAVRKEMLGK